MSGNHLVNNFHAGPANGSATGPPAEDELDCTKELLTTNPMNLPSPLKNELINELVENNIQRQATASIFHSNSPQSHSFRKLHSRLGAAGKAKLASFMVQKKLAQSSLIAEVKQYNDQWHCTNQRMEEPHSSLHNHPKRERSFTPHFSITTADRMMAHNPHKNPRVEWLSLTICRCVCLYLSISKC